MIKNTLVSIQKFPQTKKLAKVLLHLAHISYTLVSDRILINSQQLELVGLRGKTMVSRITVSRITVCPAT